MMTVEVLIIVPTNAVANMAAMLAKGLFSSHLP